MSVLKQTVDIMVDLANKEIKLRGGTTDTKNFFKKWFEMVNMPSVREQSIREIILSSNLFVYRYDAGIKSNKLRKFAQGEKPNKTEAAKTVMIPWRYVILNPADICTYYDISLSYHPTYFRMIDISTKEQIKRMRGHAFYQGC